jgi:hypothetical protein
MTQTEPENLDIWDATCWPLRVIVRGDYEYTLVKHDLEIEGRPTEKGSMVEAPAPPAKEGWEACPCQDSIPSPLDKPAREEFLRKETQRASTFVDDGKNFIEREIHGQIYISPKRKPLPKECMDCECLYADLNEYFVYRRRRRVILP